MDRIEGRTVFITGGARGIGLGIARAFAGAGAKLALADLDDEALAAARAELGSRTAVHTVRLDVRDAGPTRESRTKSKQPSGLCRSSATTPESLAARR